jgi:uncharacterized protein YprB with RNaseH-like and TPR domain
MEAYLDIETTGLSPCMDAITVVGIYRRYPEGFQMAQLVGPDITREAVETLLDGVETLYTYNGIRFDAVFLESRLQVTFPCSLTHKDLMHDCWRHGLYGGLKSVERQLGIDRTLSGVSGREAVYLWWRYVRSGDTSALQTLLRYNQEDVLNLKVLRERLAVD